jgi:hypothetical protein
MKSTAGTYRNEGTNFSPLSGPNFTFPRGDARLDVYNSQYQSTADVETGVQNRLGVVEGAFCTAKSIPHDFFGMGPLSTIPTTHSLAHRNRTGPARKRSTNAGAGRARLEAENQSRWKAGGPWHRLVLRYAHR